MIELLYGIPEEQHTPYGALENSYWNEPRDVCVVDEINPIDDANNAEVICTQSPKNETWVRTVAALHGFDVEKQESSDPLGKFWKFIVKQRRVRK